MNHIMVCADFPGATQEQADAIYNWLYRRNWIRITSPDDELNNVWYGTFNRHMLERECRALATQNFVEAAQQHHSTVQLSILWGAKKSVSKTTATIANF